MTLAGHFENGSTCFKKIPDDTYFKKIPDVSFSSMKEKSTFSVLSLSDAPIFTSLGIYIYI